MTFFGKGGRGGDSGERNRFAMLAEVRAYWEGLRQGSELPRREDIDPRGIAGALENTFLLERVAPGIARFRIAGMELHDLMGMDVRGMPLSALVEPAGRTRLAEVLERVFAEPSAALLSLEGERGIGRPALEGRVVILPLTTQRGNVGLAMGCLAMEGQTGRAPRRFAIAQATSEKIERRMGPRRLAERDEPDRRAPATGLAEFPADFVAGLPRPPRSKVNLRLVYSRD